MRNLARRSVSVAAGLVALAVLGAGPVAALDCVGPAEATPQSFADGTAMLFDDNPFLGSDAFVLIGEIVERREADGPGDHHPPPQVTIRVSAAIGRNTIGATQVVDNDPTWGWDWPVGEQRLFVVWEFDGRSPELDVCLPGLVIDDPDTLAAELEPIAEAAGTPFARPDTAPGSGSPVVLATSHRQEQTSHGGAIIAAAAALTIVVVVVSRTR
jgi:hypothetical protein